MIAIILWLLVVPWVGSAVCDVVFPDHTHLHFCVNVINVINLRVLFERLKTEYYDIIDL